MNKRLFRKALVGLSVGLAFSLAAPAMAQRKSKAEREKEREAHAKQAEEKIAEDLKGLEPVVYTADHLAKANRKATFLKVMYGRGIGDAELQVLSEFTKLQRLTLTPLRSNSGIIGIKKVFTPITAVGIRHTGAVPALESLDLEYRLDAAAISELTKLKKCKRMTLRVDADFDDKKVVQLSQLTHLSSLKLYGLRFVSDRIFDALATLKDLESLLVAGSLSSRSMYPGGKSSADMAESKAMDSTHGFGAFGNYGGIPNEKVSGRSLRSLRRLKSLSKLWIYGFDALSDASVAALVQASDSLEWLAVAYCKKVGDGTAKAASEHESIAKLQLCGTKVSPSGLKRIAKSDVIETLYIQNCESVGDSGLSAVAKSTSIVQLSVSSSKITTAGLMQLAAMKDTLKKLDCGWNLRQTSPQAIADLRKAMPNTTIR